MYGDRVVYWRYAFCTRAYVFYEVMVYSVHYDVLGSYAIRYYVIWHYVLVYEVIWNYIIGHYVIVYDVCDSSECME